MATNTDKSDDDSENIKWTAMPYADVLRRIRRTGYSEVVVIDVDALPAADEKAAREAQDADAPAPFETLS